MRRITVMDLELPPELTRKLIRKKVELLGELCKQTRADLITKSFSVLEIEEIQVALQISGLDIAPTLR